MVTDKEFQDAKREVNEADAAFRASITFNADGTNAYEHKRRLLAAQSKLTALKVERAKEKNHG